MISCIAFAFAAFFNAVMDTLQDHFYNSGFKKLNPKFWCKQESWKGKKILGMMVLDGWHLAKFGWIGSVLISLYFFDGNLWLYPIIWFVVFEGFYSKILKDN